MTQRFVNQQPDGTQYIMFLQELFVAIGSGKGDVEQIFVANKLLLNRELPNYLPLICNYFKNYRNVPEENILKTAAKVANCIQNCILGDRAGNIEIAIQMNRMLAEFCHSKSFVECYAISQIYLADAYKNRILGSRKDNIEQQIKACNAALAFFNRQNHPYKWGMIKKELCWAYLERILGSRKDNIEQAIQASQAALEVFNRTSYPYEWGSSKNSIGWAYAERIAGERGDNIEQAIQALQEALEILTQDSYPLEWAITQNSLGVAFWKRVKGERRDNIEQAIQAHNNSLKILTFKAFPHHWAMNQQNLGNVYLDRIAGDRKESIESAIKSSLSALNVYTVEKYPAKWALAKNSLGNAYCLRIAENKATNIELGIKAYQAALTVYTHEISPYEWARTKSNLANAYCLRVLGEREDNLELALKTYQEVLEIYTREIYPYEWARTQENLANLYGIRIAGDRENNLELAMYNQLETLRVYTRRTHPYEWARTQDNIGIAYYERIAGDKQSNIELAIAAFNAALTVYTRETHPYEWAKIQNNLGAAYINRLIGNQAQNIKLAITAYRAALSVRTHSKFPYDWAMTQYNLGNAFSKRTGCDKKENLKQEFELCNEGVEAYREALKIFTPTALPRENIRVITNLGKLFVQHKKWLEVIDTYHQAVESIENIRSFSLSDISRQNVQGKAIYIYETIIRACIELSDFNRAIEYKERFCSRMLVDIVSGREFEQDDLKPEAKELIRVYQALQTLIDRERQYQSNKSNSQLPLSDNDTPENNRASIQASSEKIIELEREKQLVFQEIRKEDPVLAGTVQVDPLEFEQIQQLISDSQTAIVSFYAIGEDTHIFIIYQDRKSQHYICQQQETDLKTWIYDYWLQPYQVAFDTKELDSKEEKRQRKKQRQKWADSVSATIEELSQRLNLNHLIEEYLQGIEELIIIPHGYLHNIPFAALPISDTEYLNDRFRIRHAPSCQILKFCQDRKPVANIAYGTVEDADGSLPGAKIEGQKVAQLFDIPEKNRLIGKEQSTVTEYRQLAKRVQALHSSHHANSRLDNPLESTLKLANGSITLGELLLWRLDDLEEVFLSCCETNLGITQSTDDVLTLASGFLCAGARGVVSSLWVADDLSAILLSTFYYQLRKQGKSRSEALQQAQQKLRRLTGEELAELFQSDLKPYLDYRFGQKLEEARKAYSKADREFNKINQLHPKSKECRYWYKEKTKRKRKADKYRDILNGFKQFLCQQSHPFANPYYWGVFICSGLA